MKRIEAIIPHQLIQDVEKALIRIGIEGLTLTSVYTQRMHSSEVANSPKSSLLGTPSCKLDVLVSDEELPKVHAALVQSVGAHLQIQICVLDLETTIRIRTGECEEAAIG
jgi:nitrogen regulatory protein PII